MPRHRRPRLGVVDRVDAPDRVGRAEVGPEANAPNTIQTLDGSPLAAGKTVRIEATEFYWETAEPGVSQVASSPTPRNGGARGAGANRCRRGP